MRTGAPTPEELDALLEDAFVVRDARAVAALFETDALVADGVAGEARGARAIASFAAATWSQGLTYVGAAPRVLQARETALVVSPRVTGVARRDDGGAWRYAIALLSLDQTTAKEGQ